MESNNFTAKEIQGQDEFIKFCDNGDIFIKGKLAQNDKEVVDGLRDFLQLNGYLQRNIPNVSMLNDYEVKSSVWAKYISWGWLQKLAGKYFAWKVRTKYNRYLKYKGKN